MPVTSSDVLRRAKGRTPLFIRRLAALGIELRLRARNVASTKTILGDVPVTVSVTSYGKRLSRVYLALESVARGSTRPVAMVLWVEDEEVIKNPPPELRRLVRRGLRVGLCPKIGPHSKYWPYVRERVEPLALVTLDDDTVYPTDWLLGLWKGHEAHPHDIVVYRARSVLLTGSGFAPYSAWPLCTNDEALFSNFPTGTSGAIYPVDFLDHLARRGSAFLDCCPTNDDVWIHYVATVTGYKVRQISTTAHKFRTITGSDAEALYPLNYTKNDAYLHDTHDADSLKLLRAEVAGPEA